MRSSPGTSTSKSRAFAARSSITPARASQKKRRQRFFSRGGGMVESSVIGHEAG
jgi:hypothetical protein